MLCKNGLHEIDPDDPWRGKNGARCRECLKATKKRGYEKPEYKEWKKIYDNTHRVRVCQGGERESFYFSDSRDADDLRIKLSAFRANQIQEYREARENGWFNTPIEGA